MSERILKCRENIIEAFREKGLELAPTGNTHKFKKPQDQYGFKVKLNAQRELDIAMEMGDDLHRRIISAPQDFPLGDYILEAGITYHPIGNAYGSVEYFPIHQGKIQLKPTQYFNTRESQTVEEKVVKFSEELVRRILGSNRLEDCTIELLLPGN